MRKCLQESKISCNFAVEKTLDTFNNTHIMKRLIIIFAVLLATTSMMADEFKIGKLTFETISSTEVALIDAEYDISNVFLGETIDYKGKTYAVTSIGELAFRDRTALTSIAIPKSVTSIGWYTFDGTALYDNPANWENGALYINNCLIKVDKDFVGHFRIKENTRVIADGAFRDCKSLTSVTIPNSKTIIGFGAFPEHTQIIRQ